jgi:hypothetical protein
VAAAASSAPVPLARSKEAERRSTLRFMCPLSWSAGARAKGLAGGGGGGDCKPASRWWAKEDEAP